MLNPFPELLTYGQLGPLILRIVLGLVFLNLGYLKLTKEKGRWEIFMQAIRLSPPDIFVKALAALEIVLGASLFVGFYTQYAAIGLLLLTVKEALVEYREDVLVARNFVFYVLLTAVLLSLLVSGAGFWAFDLPL